MANAGWIPGDPFEGLKYLSVEGCIYFAWLTRDLSDKGVGGDPAKASAEQGERILSGMAKCLAKALGEIARFEFRRRGS